MSTPVYYNPTFHDLYIYDSAPVIDWQGNSFSWAVPIGYNPDLYIKNIQDFVTGASAILPIDFSGILARKRGAALVFDQQGSLNPTPAPGTRPNPAYFGGVVKLPEFPINSNSNFSGPLATNIVQDGFCGQYYDVINDYKFWNTGEVPGCLISPMHILVGGHMFIPFMGANRGPFNADYGNTANPFMKVFFLGKDEVLYEKIANLKIICEDCLEENEIEPGKCVPVGAINDGQRFSSNFFQNFVFGVTGYGMLDLAILELESPLTEEELAQIKICKIGYSPNWTNSYPTFEISPNGTLYVERGTNSGSAQIGFFNKNTVQTVPYAGYYDLATDPYGVIFGPPFINYGDSCNFLYGYYPPTGDTVFLTSLNTASGAVTNANKFFIKALRDWIYQRTLDVMGEGYYIGWLEHSNITDYVEINGNYYLGGVTLPANAGTGGMTYFYGGLSPGNTYSFLVTARNAIGYSGYAGPTGFRAP